MQSLFQTHSFSPDKNPLGEDDKDDVGKESDDLEYGYQNYYM